jgi:hypothetical protein
MCTPLLTEFGTNSVSLFFFSLCGGTDIIAWL